VLRSWVDDYGLSRSVRRLEDALAQKLCEKALRVVGDHHGRTPRDLRPGGVENPRLVLPLEALRGLVIEAEQLLLLAKEAYLANGRPAVAHRDELDSGVCGLHDQLPPRLVVANQPDQHRLTPEGRDVAGGVACSSKDGTRRGHGQHGYWGLRRDAGAVACQVLVQDDIAEHEHLMVRKTSENAAQRPSHDRFHSV
jgi:hypothetical protein